MGAGNNSAWQPHIWSDQRRWHALSQSRIGALIGSSAKWGQPLFHEIRSSDSGEHSVALGMLAEAGMAVRFVSPSGTDGEDAIKSVTV